MRPETLPVSPLQPLRLALALSVVGAVRGDELVALATRALASGVTSASLPTLAGLTGATSEEAQELLKRVQSELQLPSPSRSEAALAVACNHARRILAGELTARDGADLIGKEAFRLARPQFDLSNFLADADSIDESSARRHSDPARYDELIAAAENDIRSAARSLLVDHPEL